METIKVNMSPNPLDVQTIHASQNDGEARQWEFELHNNGDVIDSSEISDQLVFKAYKGGTEQILPENGSTPTTSPFLGDIRYPQGLLTDQEFTYRQSPTEEDGLAKITDIKGNTLVWNQLVDTDTSSVTLTSGHKFITKVNGAYSLIDGTGQSLSVTGGTDEVFDLTKMGLDSITADDFTSLFPLSYYSYNQGSLLSFMGNGIKTVGFNQWDEEWENGSITSSGVLQPISSAIRSKNFCPCLPNTTYYLRMIEGSTGQAICWYDSAKNFIIRVTDQQTRNAISPSNASYFKLSLYNYKIQDYVTYNNDVCLNISDTLKNGTYEPYTSSTLSLPISTYFPTGMKSAGNVYDELTESKAITRVGSRAYQSGDESDTSVITDGTTTYYALVTPTETSFTTASLVTENAEIPLSNEDGTLIGKCTEELSAEPGFHDAKIKLSDSDGECYSNKIQLHIERSPQ